MPYPAELVVFLALGAVLGALGGLFGIGGGLIAIPVLVLFFHLDQQHAQGTALVMVTPNVLMGLWGYARRGSVDRRVAIVLAACAVAFTFLGALWATRFAGPALRYYFAAFIAVLAIYFSYRAVRDAKASQASGSVPRTRLGWGWTSLVGIAGGILSGMFSVGGAVFAIPALTLLFGYTQKEAQGLSLAMIAPGAVVGIITYALAGDVDWRIGIPMAIGGLLSVRYGVALAYRLPERELRLLFGGLLVCTALALFFAP